MKQKEGLTTMVVGGGGSQYLTAPIRIRLQYDHQEECSRYKGLLQLAGLKIQFGGGQVTQPSLVPLLRFDIQGVARVA